MVEIQETAIDLVIRVTHLDRRGRSCSRQKKQQINWLGGIQ